MKYGVYFLAILIIGLFFELAEPIEEEYFPGLRDLFLLSSHRMHVSSFVYYICEHLTNALLALTVYKLLSVIILFYNTQAFKQAQFFTVVYGSLEIADAFDFWITANSTWSEVGGWPITFNTIKVFVFVVFLLLIGINGIIKSNTGAA